VYGKVAALNVDPIEKKPLYHFLPGTTALSLGTVGCNMKCPFCQNWQISQTHDIGSSQEIAPEQIVELALRYGSDTIAYTYNEPTIFYPFAKDVAVLAKKAGLKNIFVSNGMESQEVLEDMDGLIDGFNIDLKSFKADYYKKTLKGSLDWALDTMKIIKQQRMWLEVTTLIVPGDNDSDEELKQIAGFIADELDVFTPWHISAFHPDYKVQDKETTSMELLANAKRIGEEKGLKYIYMGNVMTDAKTYCPACGEMLIDRFGFDTITNRLIYGTCPACGREIEGVWSKEEVL
jgi:pyruvate formate lyase activating enzyme